MIQVARPFFRNKELIIKAIDSILESGKLMNGEMTDSFEREFAKYIGTKYAISVNSCTTALEIVLRYIGVKNHEVIVPTNTFIATSNAVLFAEGTPIFADIKQNSYNIDPNEIEKRITNKTKAVIVVHIAGIVCEDILKIKKICEKHGLYLIEDCAHATGAEFKKNKAGSFGFASCFSFYPTKIMTTGTGGMITTNSSELKEFAGSVKFHGKGENGLSEIVNLGNDWFMDEIKSTIGLFQLRDLDNLISRRREIAQEYYDKLKNVDSIKIFPIHKNSKPSYYKFPVQLDERIEPINFKNNFLLKYNIELESVYWPTSHLQPVYQKLFGCRRGDFPTAEKILDRQITLPIHPLIKDEDIDFVISKLETELCV